MNVTHPGVLAWVDEITRLTAPAQVTWIDGTASQYQALLAEGVRTGQLLPLHPTRHPGSFLHRSHPNDTARTEHCTYVCTENRDDAGPNNNWLAPDEASARLRRLLDGAMRGRTMYAIPFLMGPAGSPFSLVGFELTDSVYVAVNMYLMARVGRVALEHLGAASSFVKGVHSVGTLDPEQRYICHFPEARAIASVNSGYGGNALLGKKCLALRLASWFGHREGWLAEHMLIIGIEDPRGRVTYLAAAFPSMCGKTNLAMLKPGGVFGGYRVWCVGDDIAWLRIGADGRLYAVNPEAGFFGVAPGTSPRTNPYMMETIARNTIFTNVAMTKDHAVWWEGLALPDGAEGMVDWQARPWDPSGGQKAAHPNARFTVSTTQCPVLSSRWDDPRGVPLSAILFGARRPTVMPLVMEAFDWTHGVYLGATLASETTAAATGTVGVLRNDPMAMLPFCGYHMGDYFAHWLAMGRRMTHPPRIFRVNWFRADGEGKFLWPGFGDNMRVLRWIMDRCAGAASAVETPIGFLPMPDAIDADGLSISPETLRVLLEVDRAGWRQEVDRSAEYLDRFGSRLPDALRAQQHAFAARVAARERADSGSPARMP